jgi:predicted HTH transcriptional regulator
VSRMKQVIETLEAERADVQERLAWLEQQLAEFRRRAGEPAPPASRAPRRATARRASTRRATARSRQSDTKAKIVEFLTKHPSSTAGDVARALNLNRNSVSTRLASMAKTGEIAKASKGYSAK